ncbi:hypothetical protein AB0B45_33780 [Nonomuraea sp. NPDC049152]|uniref:hypothetical protein n=1 Tax=Nonomuraea sp. NPDC049152 TaxID=3154350 RepID=UPI0033D11088
MSEVVPLPSFGEVFFDARGQERCLRVTWHEGTLVLSLWRGEMCTGSFRMPMDDVGRLLDTLDDGYAEATGEEPAAPAVQPVAEPGEYPGTGQYHRPPPFEHEPLRAPDDRPTATLSPNDVLVARGAPAPQDKLVASYGDQRETAIPADGRPRLAEQPPVGAEPMAAAGPGYPMPDYQLPAEREGARGPQSTDPLGFPRQSATPYSTHSEPFAAQSTQPDPFGAQGAQHDPFATQPGTQGYPQPRQDAYAQDPYAQTGRQPAQPYTDPFAPPPQRAQSAPGSAGLGTPMHGIPGAGRRTAPEPYPQPEPYGQQDQYGQPSYQQQAPMNPSDPLGLGPEAYQNQQPDPAIHRPYVGDQMYVTGERLRPEQQHRDDRTDRREW